MNGALYLNDGMIAARQHNNRAALYTGHLKSIEDSMKNTLKQLFFIILLLSPLTGAGSDLGKEKRWSEQIVDSLLDGEAVQLEAKGQKILGLYTPASNGSTVRAAILLHGMGAHPDWPEVINPLRSELPEHGWATLSVQMPVLANDAALTDYAPLFAEAGPRIESAVSFLQEKGYEKIALIGHSLGAAMAATYLGTSTKNIDGFVAIGLGIIDNDKMNALPALAKIQLPVLDLYGSRDLDNVLATAPARARAARKASNKNYRQQQIEGADHFFSGSQGILVRTVYGWLKRYFGPKSVTPK